MRWQALHKTPAWCRNKARCARKGVLGTWLRVPVLLPVAAVVAALSFPFLDASLATARRLAGPTAVTIGPMDIEHCPHGLVLAHASLASLSSNDSRLSGED